MFRQAAARQHLFCSSSDAAPTVKMKHGSISRGTCSFDWIARGQPHELGRCTKQPEMHTAWSFAQLCCMRAALSNSYCPCNLCQHQHQQLKHCQHTSGSARMKSPLYLKSSGTRGINAPLTCMCTCRELHEHLVCSLPRINARAV